VSGLRVQSRIWEFAIMGCKDEGRGLDVVEGAIRSGGVVAVVYSFNGCAAV